MFDLHKHCVSVVGCERSISVGGVSGVSRNERNYDKQKHWILFCEVSSARVYASGL